MIKEVGNCLVLIRGAGDLASGVAIRLHRSGFKVVMLEIDKPTVIRTTVSFAQAYYDKEVEVENIKARLCSKEEVASLLKTDTIPVVVDPQCTLVRSLKPQVVVDGIIAKRNLGTRLDMADFVIALGPGFEAGKDCDAVIETSRGHSLGKVIYYGSALPNTGIPGLVGGYGIQRVVHSPCSGVFKSACKIGSIVKEGDIIAYVGSAAVKTIIGGKVRGMLNDNIEVPEGFKVADVDPRGESVDHTTSSDKARSIAGGVLEAIMAYLSK